MWSVTGGPAAISGSRSLLLRSLWQGRLQSLGHTPNGSAGAKPCCCASCGVTKNIIRYKRWPWEACSCLFYVHFMFIWGLRILTPTGSAATSGFPISGLYRLICERGVWFVVLGGGGRRRELWFVGNRVYLLLAVEVQAQTDQRLLMPSVHFSNPLTIFFFFFLSPWLFSFCIQFFFVSFLTREGEH